MVIIAWIGRIGLVMASFILFLLGLMKLFPVALASLCLFLSIVFALRPFQRKQRFKGFRF